MPEARRVGLGVAGGIAAYKVVEVCSRLKRLGADVQVVMTRNAMRFVRPLTFRTISGNPVIAKAFGEPSRWNVEHVEFARWAEIIAVAPATANVIGKVASGVADDFLTTAIMAAKCTVLFAPAMNAAMYENPIVQGNIGRLRSLGYEFVEPGEGWLACGEEGHGRLAEPEAIVDRILGLLPPCAAQGGGAALKDLAGVKIMVTAGPTREFIDPVRFISNPSSGKMGFAVAEAARARGAEVILVSGPVALTPPAGVRFLPVTTARDMREAVMANLEWCDVLIKSAAVSDYAPESVSPSKIKKGDTALDLRLVPAPDILLEAGRRKGSRILVGFAAETDDVVENARAKMVRKNLDLIVVNDVKREGAGFACDSNAGKMIDWAGAITDIPMTSKRAMAGIILDRVAAILKQRRG